MADRPPPRMKIAVGPPFSKGGRFRGIEGDFHGKKAETVIARREAPRQSHERPERSCFVRGKREALPGRTRPGVPALFKFDLAGFIC